MIADMNQLFSIVLLVKDSRHLLPLTLDTLNAQLERNFEVILVGGKEVHKLKELVSHYPEMKIDLCLSGSKTISGLMNEGMKMARGKYLQFIEAGDRFLSQHGLSYVKELIEESGGPHLAYSGFLMRGPDGPPHAMTFPLNLQILQRGMVPTVLRSSWFLKETVLGLGGFNGKLTHRSAFDLLCKLFLKKGLRAVYTRRVVTDSELQRANPREMIGYASETFRILYRYFGIWHALRWIFVQDHLNILSWCWRLIRQAFCKTCI